MVDITLHELSKIVNGKLKGDGNYVFNRIAIDSRRLVVPIDTLFVALVGVNNNGHTFIKDLIDKGVRCFLVSEASNLYQKFGNCGFIQVSDTLKALQALARYRRNLIQYPILAITGSNGKTIIKEWIVQLLEHSFLLSRSPRSYNSQVGVPLSLWMLESDVDLGVIEAGISLPNEMSCLQKAIHPNWGLISNIGEAHQENFKSLEHKLNEKLKLFESCEIIFCCADQINVFNAIQNQFANQKLVTWGRSDWCDLQLIKSEQRKNQLILSLKWKDKIFDVELPFSDLASLENAMHAMLVALFMGVEISLLINNAYKFKSVSMRLEQKEGINQCVIINDSYSSDLNSLEVALDFLNQQAIQYDMSRAVVLSDIYQSGIKAPELYQRVVHLLNSKGVLKVIGVGADIQKYANLFPNDSLFYASTDELINSGVLTSLHKNVILVKGARDFLFERVVERLEFKHHQTVMEVNLNALVHNINSFRSLLKPETKILAMVKAFSYGSGSFEIASVLQHHKIDYLGVAYADEGMELRRSGISLPIMVMNPEKSSFAMMLEYQLEPEIYSFNVLRDFVDVVKSQGLVDVPIHIKVDSGMYRLGFLPDEMQSLAEELNLGGCLRVKSVFSHLVGSEDAVHDAFTQQQIAVFTSFSNDLEAKIGYPFLKHLLNSSGVERFPAAQFDMVRLGIGMYGIQATSKLVLMNVATLKTYVSQVKQVQSGETIGYGRRGRISGAGQIAIIPIGYADGLDRRLGNGVGTVLLNSQLVPIVGSVCMDMCMIDITGIEVVDGDEVIVFGDDIPVWKISEAIGTIPYEVLTGISRRVKRVYYME